MTYAVVFFSKSGVTAAVANQVAGRLGAQTEAIRRAEKSGAFTFIKEIAQSLSGGQPEIQPLSLDVASFDHVVIGTPVWAGHVSSPVSSFLARYGGGIRSASAFVTHGDPKNGYPDVFAQLETMLGKKLDASYSVSSHDVKSGVFDTSAFTKALLAPEANG